jgi:hypothetical protein
MKELVSEACYEPLDLEKPQNPIPSVKDIKKEFLKCNLLTASSIALGIGSIAAYSLKHPDLSGVIACCAPIPSLIATMRLVKDSRLTLVVTEAAIRLLAKSPKVNHMSWGETGKFIQTMDSLKDKGHALSNRSLHSSWALMAGGIVANCSLPLVSSILVGVGTCMTMNTLWQTRKFSKLIVREIEYLDNSSARTAEDSSTLLNIEESEHRPLLH